MSDSLGGGVRWLEFTRSECFELVACEHVGRVAVVDDRGPVVVPVNFVLDRHMVVFRTDGGTKLDAASRGSRVAFEVDGIDASAHTGLSVLVRGEAVEVTIPPSWRGCASCPRHRARCQLPEGVPGHLDRHPGCDYRYGVGEFGAAGGAGHHLIDSAHERRLAHSPLPRPVGRSQPPRLPVVPVPATTAIAVPLKA